MPHEIILKSLIEKALREDLGHGHDITSESLLPPDYKATAVMRARKDGVIAGVKTAAMTFEILDSSLDVKILASSGDTVKTRDKILEVSGAAASIFTAERVALNLISHLSGIATETARYVAEVKGTNAHICCTRKTLPGLRALQKYAVRAGGGMNHRFGLDDAILIKDNHISIAGGINEALDAAKSKAGHMVKIEIEVDTLDQLQEVLDHGGADIVMLDNMGPDKLREAIQIIDGRLITEASGGITLDTVRAVAEAGVDLISVGALTHSITALDIGLDIDL